MSHLYQHNDLNPMSWQEFGAIIDRLASDICSYATEHNLTFDAVAPLLRSGGVPGCALAVRLTISRLIPLQFKYDCRPKRLVHLHSPDEALMGLPQKPGILIVETNTASGKTASQAIAWLNSRIPSASLYYATVARVYRTEYELNGLEHVFTGIETNEGKLASEEEAQRLKLRPGVTLFPWEVGEDELEQMNSA